MKKYIAPAIELQNMETSPVMVDSLTINPDPSNTIEPGYELSGSHRGSDWADYEK